MDVRGPGESPLAWVTRSVGDVAELAVVVLGLAAEQVEGFAGGGVVASDQDGEGLVDDAARVEGLLELAHQGGVFCGALSLSRRAGCEGTGPICLSVHGSSR